MRKQLFILFLLVQSAAGAQWFSVPEQQILLNALFPDIHHTHDIKITVKPFQLSRQVTLREYKEFLTNVKKDSGETVYVSLLPDTNIAPGNIYEKYFNSGKYDDFPVVGISWDNALRYCKWLTLKNNPDSLKCIYRLPNLYEYYSAYTHLQKSAVDNDLNNLYADWLMDTRDESLQGDGNGVPLSYYYFHSKSDPNSMKRKMVIGKSFLHAFNQLQDYLMINFYAQEGYSHIGFRIVMDSNPESLEKQIVKTDNKDNLKYNNPLLQYWNIIPLEE